MLEDFDDVVVVFVVVEERRRRGLGLGLCGGVVAAIGVGRGGGGFERGEG